MGAVLSMLDLAITAEILPFFALGGVFSLYTSHFLALSSISNRLFLFIQP